MRLLIAAAIACSLVSQSGAAIVYESFDYTAGANLAGQVNPANGETWFSTGTGGTGGSDEVVIANDNLTIPGLVPSLGNSISYQGTGLTPRLSLGPTGITSGTVYYSLALKLTGLTGLSGLPNGVFVAGFNNSTGTQTGQPTIVGARLLLKPGSTANTFNIGTVKNSSTSSAFSFDTVDRNVGETIFIVASYTFNSGTTTDDSVSLWINPDPITFGAAVAPPATITGNVTGSDLASLSSFIFRQGNGAVPDIVADELRIDTTWAGVTPVPEPSTIAVAAVGCGLLLAFGRRRRCA